MRRCSEAATCSTVCSRTKTPLVELAVGMACTLLTSRSGCGMFIHFSSRFVVTFVEPL